MAWSFEPKTGVPSWREPRPATLGDARRLIQATFEKNNWDERSRRYYLNRHGVRPQETATLTKDECQLVLDAMGRSHMIIFEEREENAASNKQPAVGTAAVRA